MKKNSESPRESTWSDVISVKGIPSYNATDDPFCSRMRTQSERTGKPTKVKPMTFADIQNNSISSQRQERTRVGRRTGKIVKVTPWSVGDEISPPRKLMGREENAAEIMLREAKNEEPESSDHIRKILTNWNIVFGDVVESWAFYGVNQQILPKVKNEVNAVRREQELLRELEEIQRYTQHKANLRAARQIEMTNRSRAKHEYPRKPQPPSNERSNVRRRTEIPSAVREEPKIPKPLEMTKPTKPSQQAKGMRPFASTKSPSPEITDSIPKGLPLEVNRAQSSSNGTEDEPVGVSQEKASLSDISLKSIVLDSTASTENDRLESSVTVHISSICEHMESL